jgi:hypothetical protein
MSAMGGLYSPAAKVCRWSSIPAEIPEEEDMGLFTNRFANSAFEEFEGPGAPAKSGMVLTFMIPDAPYSDALFERLHNVFDVVEGVHATLTIFEIEIAGLLGLGLEVLAPFAGFVASLMAIGAGYARARAIVARRAMISGFAHGVAMGAYRTTWAYAKQMFWQYNAYRYATPMDEAIGPIGQKSFNLGLVCGFSQGRHLTAGAGQPATQQEKFFWKSIGQGFSEGDRYKYGGDTKQWDKNMWSDWYIRVAAGFIKLYAKESE